MLCFNLTKESYKKFRINYMRYEFKYQILLELIGCILVSIMTSLFLFANKNFSKNLYIISIGIWIIFCCYCNIKNKKDSLKQIIKDINTYEKLNMFGQCTILILNEGLCVKYNCRTKMYTWNIIKYSIDIKGDLYIIISSAEYVVISKEAFNSSDEFKLFIQRINNHKKVKNSTSLIESI